MQLWLWVKSFPSKISLEWIRCHRCTWQSTRMTKVNAGKSRQIRSRAESGHRRRGVWHLRGWQQARSFHQ